MSARTATPPSEFTLTWPVFAATQQTPETQRRRFAKMPALPRVDRIKTVYSAAKALNYGWRFEDFLKVPSYNGVGRYIPQLHRITFRFCKQSECSAGMRNFIQENATNIGQTNPSTVIYAQPVRFSNPIIRAEYGNGRVVQVNVKNMSSEEIARDVHLLYSRSGEAVVKLESRQSSVVPSLQGEWTPIIWLPAKLNSEQLPNPNCSEFKSTKVSATDYIFSTSEKRN